MSNNEHVINATKTALLSLYTLRHLLQHDDCAHNNEVTPEVLDAIGELDPNQDRPSGDKGLLDWVRVYGKLEAYLTALEGDDPETGHTLRSATRTAILSVWDLIGAETSLLRASAGIVGKALKETEPQHDAPIDARLSKLQTEGELMEDFNHALDAVSAYVGGYSNLFESATKDTLPELVDEYMKFIKGKWSLKDTPVGEFQELKFTNFKVVAWDRTWYPLLFSRLDKVLDRVIAYLKGERECDAQP